MTDQTPIAHDRASQKGAGIPVAPRQTMIAGKEITWGQRTLVMGIVNVTPDSFSGDGLLGIGVDPVALAVAQARQMVADGAELLDVGGESTRPGHERTESDEERRRVLPVVRAIHLALPDTPISIDTTRPAVAAAALDAGAAILNHVWGVGEDQSLARLAAERGVPIVLMHNRAEALYANLIVELIADLARAIDRAVQAGVSQASIIVDPGFGFGKTAEQNVAVLHDLGSLRRLGCPILLGTSRKSTLGKILGLPLNQRLEATLATTALAIAAGVDIVRVHDVLENVRVARIADAIVRGWEPAGDAAEPTSSATHSDLGANR